MRHGLPRQRLVWTPEADQKLITAVERYGIDNWQLGTFTNVHLLRLFPSLFVLSRSKRIRRCYSCTMSNSLAEISRPQPEAWHLDGARGQPTSGWGREISANEFDIVQL